MPGSVPANVCVLTDGTVQFAASGFPGRELISILPYQTLIEGQPRRDGREARLSQFPPSSTLSMTRRLRPPQPDEFRQAFRVLGQRYREIIILLGAASLLPAYANALQAVQSTYKPAALYLLDAHTVATGLGLLAQVAAEAAWNGQEGSQIVHTLQGMIPRLYTAFCVQGLTYLAEAGMLDPAQALVGEMVGVMPLFVLEDGLQLRQDRAGAGLSQSPASSTTCSLSMTAVQKARSLRHLVDMLYEFVTEFDRIKHIAIIHGVAPFEQEARLLRERLEANHRDIEVSDQPLCAPLAALFGPRSLGVVVWAL